MDAVKNNYQKVAAIVLFSVTIAGLIVYRYYFSRQLEDEKHHEKHAEHSEQRLAFESDLRPSLESDTKIKSTLEEATSTFQYEIRLTDEKSIQQPKKLQMATEDRKGTDEIDVEFSPTKSPSDDSIQILKTGSSEAHRKGQSTVNSAASPPLKKESVANVYYCNCDQILDSPSIIEGELSENIPVKLIPTRVMPIRFDRFSPVNLTGYGGTEDMSENSIIGPNYPSNHRLIVPFLPSLHMLAYASKHIELINELVENYPYYERNYDD
uniref:Uncharacterized protein n=2 Tax=Parascaris univalens TaxID=6257 RepID=A0A915B0S3_PARUN